MKKKKGPVGLLFEEMLFDWSHHRLPYTEIPFYVHFICFLSVAYLCDRFVLNGPAIEPDSGCKSTSKMCLKITSGM